MNEEPDARTGPVAEAAPGSTGPSPRRRRPRLIGLALAAVVALGTVTAVTVLGSGAAADPGRGLLRLAHLSPSTPAIDMYAAGPDLPLTLVAGAVTYRALSPYLDRPAGTYQLQARPAGAPVSAAPLFDVSVQVPAGSAQTAAFVDTGPGASPQAQVLDDETAPAPAGSALLRVVQAAAGLGPVEVTAVGGPPLARDLFYGAATPYAQVPAQPWTLEIRSRLGNEAGVTIPVTSTSVSSLVITRKDDGDLSAQVVPDAPSAVAAPSGPAPVPAVPPAGTGPGSSEQSTQAPLPEGRAPAGRPAQTPQPEGDRPPVPRAPVPPAGGIEAGAGGTAASGPVDWVSDWFGDPEPSVPPAARMAVAAATAPVPGTPRPTSVSIPSIGLAVARTVDLRIDYRGALQIPTDFSQVGWFSSSAVPGDPGPTVLAGHVDTSRGPAVFGGLDRLRPGDPVDLGRSDGATARYVVDAVEYFPKDRMPTERVYGPGTASTLRLLTCGGRFDRSTLSYENNVVVFASRR